MKFKPPTFVRYVARPLSILLFGSLAAFFIVCIAELFKQAISHTLTFRMAAFALVGCAVIVFGFWVFATGLWDKLFATITVNSDQIV